MNIKDELRNEWSKIEEILGKASISINSGINDGTYMIKRLRIITSEESYTKVINGEMKKLMIKNLDGVKIPLYLINLGVNLKSNDPEKLAYGLLGYLRKIEEAAKRYREPEYYKEQRSKEDVLGDYIPFDIY